MVKYSRWFALVALASLSACASVPMATADLDVQGKRFQAPPPGKAAFYIYRESIFGGAYSLNITMGPRPLGTLAADTWFLVDVDPGQHDMRCNAPESSDSKVVSIAAGETRYVEVAIRMGLVQPRCAVFEVNAEQGQKAVLGGKRAQEIR